MELIELNNIFKEKRAAVDFDGVIHSYTDGWRDGVPYGTLVPGSREALKELKAKGYKIYINSARFAPDLTLYGKIHTDPEQVFLVKEYLKKYDIPYDGFLPKIYAEIYIDDRAIKCDPLNDLEATWKNVLKCIP